MPRHAPQQLVSIWLKRRERIVCHRRKLANVGWVKEALPIAFGVVQNSFSMT
jgi:hypothetical protein